MCHFIKLHCEFLKTKVPAAWPPLSGLRSGHDLAMAQLLLELLARYYEL